MANKKLLAKITENTVTETKKLLQCKRCGRIYDVTNVTPEEIAKEGWTLHKYDTRYESILVCKFCTAYYRANT
jgi:uncharacterized protein YbaR (Trm112 family)